MLLRHQRRAELGLTRLWMWFWSRMKRRLVHITDSPMSFQRQDDPAALEGSQPVILTQTVFPA